MTRKLAITPDTCYLLGIFNCNENRTLITLTTTNRKLIERFVKIAVMNLKINQENITINDDGRIMEAMIKDSKLKKLLKASSERKDKIFKYKNEYSGSYFAALYDCIGATDHRGLFLKRLSNYDIVILERLGFHTTKRAERLYINNDMDFMMFISPYSLRAQSTGKSKSPR